MYEGRKYNNTSDAIIKYNVGKGFIDLTDHIGSYSSCLRRSVKCYRKVAFDLLLNVSHKCFSSLQRPIWLQSRWLQQPNISTTTFKESLVKELVRQQPQPSRTINSQVSLHILVPNKRTRCPSCYKKKVKEVGTQLAQKNCSKTTTKCNTCQIPMCKECFFSKQKVKFNSK